MSIYYAGIGSRETPFEVLTIMTNIAIAMAKKGIILRSGGAKGADSAFERGCDFNNGLKEIFYSKDATPDAIELALRFHPNPEALQAKGKYVLGLMGRNMHILSGSNLDLDVNFVICWTKDGQDSGGTGQAIRYARSKNIRIFNLYSNKDLNDLRQFYLEF